MRRRITRILLWTATIALAALLGVLPGAAIADDRNDEGAAETTAGQLEDHDADSEDPDDDVEGSEDSDRRTVGSEDPGKRRTGAEDSDSMLEGSGDVERHAADSEDLTNLPGDRPDAGDDSIDDSGQSRGEPMSASSEVDPEVVIARNNLVRAEKRAAAARSAYGDMIQRDYPRGDARVQIVKERDAAMKAYEDAKRALAATEN